MPSSISAARRAVEHLVCRRPDGGAAEFFLGLLAAALAERVGRLPATSSPDEALERLESATGYSFSLPSGEISVEALVESWTRAKHLAAEGTPHAILTGTYEEILRWRPGEGSTTTSLPSNEHRKREGAFYTSPAVAAWVVEQALAPLRTVSDPRILDPAMGTGVFLREALWYLEAPHPARAAERCLFGIDRDPVAVRLAVLALWIETGARPEILREHLQCADALHAPGEEMFDAVIGNPPWGAQYKREEREVLRTRFPGSCRRSFDSFKLFLDLGSSLSHGTLGMVVPQACLTQQSHADIREVLLHRLAPYAARTWEDRIFRGVAAPACALVFGPKPGPRAIVTGCSSLPAARWSAQGFPLAPDAALALLSLLCAASPALGDLTTSFCLRDVGINYNRAAVAARIFYRGARQDVRDIPRYRGRNFGRYTSIVPDGWLRHDARDLLREGETLSLSWKTYRLPEKIVLRQTADRPIATLDRSRMAMGRSVIALTAEEGLSLRALLACLNSRLVTTLYRSLSGEEGRILPQVKVGTLLRLPVPAISASPLPPDLLVAVEQRLTGDVDGLMQEASGNPTVAWAALDRLAERMLQSQGRDAVTEHLLDRLVEALYGVTAEERSPILATELGARRRCHLRADSERG